MYAYIQLVSKQPDTIEYILPEKEDSLDVPPQQTEGKRFMEQSSSEALSLMKASSVSRVDRTAELFQQAQEVRSTPQLEDLRKEPYPQIVEPTREPIAQAVPQPSPIITPFPLSFPNLPRDEPLLSPQLNAPLPQSSTPSPPNLTNSPASRDTVFVRQFVFEGNTVISTEQLQEITTPFTNRHLTFAEVLQARSAVTDLYVQQGYITSGAYIPVDANQSFDPESATLKMQILEGSVEEIQVTGDRRLSQYVRSRLHRATVPVLNQHRLETALRLLQSDPLIDTIAANLSQGTQPHLSVLSVQVQGQSAITATAQVNNARSPTIGSIERGVQFNAASILGLGELLSVGYRNTEGSQAIDVGVTIPLNSSDTTVSLNFSTQKSHIIQEPFDVLDIAADSRIYELSVRQPLAQHANSDKIEELALGITLSRIESETTLANQPFPLSMGAEESGKTRITALRFFQDYQRRSDRSVLLVRSQISVGLGLWGSTLNDNQPDSRFLTWRGQVAWLQRLSGDLRLLLRTDLQLADRSLLPSEQFSLGGATSVRGYRQDAILSDNGLLTTAELQIPLLQTERSRLDVIPFLDFGVAWNHNDGQPQVHLLTSAGLGLQYQLREFRIRANYAFPLAQLDGDRSTLQEQGVSFAVDYELRF